MNEPATKTFDCVQSMREIRNRLSEDIAQLSDVELATWLRSYTYSDPLLARLALRASERARAQEKEPTTRDATGSG